MGREVNPRLLSCHGLATYGHDTQQPPRLSPDIACGVAHRRPRVSSSPLPSSPSVRVHRGLACRCVVI